MLVFDSFIHCYLEMCELLQATTNGEPEDCCCLPLHLHWARSCWLSGSPTLWHSWILPWLRRTKVLHCRSSITCTRKIKWSEQFYPYLSNHIFATSWQHHALQMLQTTFLFLPAVNAASYSESKQRMLFTARCTSWGIHQRVLTWLSCRWKAH